MCFLLDENLQKSSAVATVQRQILQQQVSLYFKDGRPKKYTPIQIEHALSLLSYGKSYKEVEAITGISKSTLLRKKKSNISA
ncbi:MAG: helix-turn-helix domain-containing protein [Oscillospiraceae bacterium]|nr:helix-turn-helix domain-containing protein [Oscillospiraceae bacterium]